MNAQSVTNRLDEASTGTAATASDVDPNKTSRPSGGQTTGISAGEFADASIRGSRPLAMGTIGIKVGDRTEHASFELKPVVDGRAELVIHAESPASRFATAVWAAVSMLAKKPSFAAAATALGLGTLAEGALIPDGASDASYVTYGSQMAGELLSFKLLVPGVGTGVRNTSATYLNSSYAITAAHNIADLLQYNPTYSVATGPNIKTNAGTTIAVDSVTLYPGYSGGFDSPDIALLHFAQPIVGGTSMSIASTSLGEVVSEAGFGVHGSPLAGQQPTDFNSRAWNAPVVAGTTNNVSSTYYFTSEFDTADAVSMNGKALSGDSGGPVFNPDGNLVGMGVGQYGNFDPIGGTEILALSQPEVYSWLQANAGVPEPTTLSFVGVATVVLFRRQRR